MKNAPPMPAHAHVIAEPEAWMETAALEQLAQVARHPACCCAVGMPDLHPGRGIPIGAAFAFRDHILPQLVGGDAGCGVRLQVVTKARFRGDALLRRVDAATNALALPEVDPGALLAAVWRSGVGGLVDLAGVPADLASLAAAHVGHSDLNASNSHRTGGVLLCDNNRLVFEEHPDTYKAIDPVIRSLTNADVADHVAELTPLITVKR